MALSLKYCAECWVWNVQGKVWTKLLLCVFIVWLLFVSFFLCLSSVNTLFLNFLLIFSVHLSTWNRFYFYLFVFVFISYTNFKLSSYICWLSSISFSLCLFISSFSFCLFIYFCLFLNTFWAWWTWSDGRLNIPTFNQYLKWE